MQNFIFLTTLLLYCAATAASSKVNPLRKRAEVQYDTCTPERQQIVSDAFERALHINTIVDSSLPELLASEPGETVEDLSFAAFFSTNKLGPITVKKMTANVDSDHWIAKFICKLPSKIMAICVAHRVTTVIAEASFDWPVQPSKTSLPIYLCPKFWDSKMKNLNVDSDTTENQLSVAGPQNWIMFREHVILRELFTYFIEPDINPSAFAWSNTKGGIFDPSLKSVQRLNNPSTYAYYVMRTYLFVMSPSCTLPTRRRSPMIGARDDGNGTIPTVPQCDPPVRCGEGKINDPANATLCIDKPEMLGDVVLDKANCNGTCLASGSVTTYVRAPTGAAAERLLSSELAGLTYASAASLSTKAPAPSGTHQ